jgi:hypothetical protein
MPRRASKPPSPEIDDEEDALASALRVVEQATGGKLVESPPKKNPHAVALSKLGASKGGQARAASLTKKRRADIATKAARTRWGSKQRPSA